MSGIEAAQQAQVKSHQMRVWFIHAGQFRQRDGLQRLVYGVVDPLPGAADAATALDAALPVVGGAGGQCHRSLERVEYGRRTDVVRRAGQAIAAMQTAL